MRWIWAVIGAIGLISGTPSAGADPGIPHKLHQLARNDSSFKIRLFAVGRLGRARPNKTERAKIISTLTHSLQDGNYLVRAAAAKGLAAQDAKISLGALERLASRDQEPFVRTAAIRAIRALNATPDRIAGTPVTIEIGRLHLADDASPLPGPSKLERTIRSALEDQLVRHQPNRGAHSADVRMDVTIVRKREPTSIDGSAIAFEVRVVLLDLPQANLRHASQAVAKAQKGGRQRAALQSLETKVAIKAVRRAVAEALSLLGDS